jgi:hypothetical protein
MFKWLRLGNRQVLADDELAAYVTSELSAPTQKSLDAVLRQADRVRFINGGVGINGPVGTDLLLEITAREDLRDVVESLSINEDSAGFHCMCLGDLAILFYAGARQIAVIGYHHASSIRWDDRWRHDALLQDGPRLARLLAEKGVPGPLRSWEEAQQRARVSREIRERWERAMPPCLLPWWTAKHQMGIPPTDLTPLADALSRAYPDPAARILALFAWLGHGVGLASGYPSYEGTALNLLSALPDDSLYAALTGTGPDDARALDGAVRLFIDWDWRRKRKPKRRRPPEPVCSMLLAHCRTSAPDENWAWSRAAFVQQYSEAASLGD